MTKNYQLSDMMRHYNSIKESYKDCIVFYRLGDFYEMFFEDAIKASRILDLTLTGRDCGLEERAPMCGVPYHAADTYISKLVKSGNKVAICEQLTQPGAQKGLLERDVIRIITPGTVTDEESLEAKSNNYLLSVALSNGIIGLAWADISTGELKCQQFEPYEINKALDFISYLKPAELLGNKEACDLLNAKRELHNNGSLIRAQDFYSYAYDYDNSVNTILNFYSVNNINSFGLENVPIALRALGGLFKYIEITQKRNMHHFDSPKIIYSNNKMFIDNTTIKNLELLENIYDNKIKGSLLWVLDKTVTNMGAREIKTTLTQPLNNFNEINKRLDAVEELVNSDSVRNRLIELLSIIRDVERLCNKVSYNSINPRECISILISLKQITPIIKTLSTLKSELLSLIKSNLDELLDLVAFLESSLVENPPVSIKDGGIIKKGFSPELDGFRDAQINAKKWLTEYEQKERESTELKTLRIGYNRIFGYYIEISNSYLGKVPQRYIRKQTLSTGERYITEELKLMEEKILGSLERSIVLEEKIFARIKELLLNNIKPILNNARLLGKLDVILSFASVSKANNYVRPLISKDKEILITNGRHPVVENIKLGKGNFIPNDTIFKKDSQTLIITGPNMAGKSTYMRQVALIVLMAHFGCFVPCSSAKISLVDRVFTRVGASDNLAFGQSTFMVEMSEVANILNNATADSLIVFDEIGRGTSTIDGLSIAWAIAEFVTLKIKAKTLFATHYHELSELETIIPCVKNYHVLIKDNAGEIVFLYKIARGGANKSFGVEVASLAGIHNEIIIRAKNIMMGLEESHDLKNVKELITSTGSSISVPTKQIGFFAEDNKYQEICDIINDINVDNCTPIEALTILSNLKKKTIRNKKNKNDY